MKNFFATILFALTLLIASIAQAYAPDGKLFVTVFDIGQGDATLIETPEQNILLDTGAPDSAEILVAKLYETGITRLEKIILTHPHLDHIGGVLTVLENFPVDEICDNGIVNANPVYRKYHQAAVVTTNLKTGDVLDLGGGVKLKILNPTPAVVTAVNSKSQRAVFNNECIVAKLTFGDFSMLFPADIGKFIETQLLENFPTELKSTILKAAHHGSRTSSTADFVAAVSPDYVFISAGRANKFGHPHKEPLATFRENFVLPENIFCTRFNGDIRTESDGKNFSIIIENPDDWVVDYSRQIITATRLD